MAVPRRLAPHLDDALQCFLHHARWHVQVAMHANVAARQVARVAACGSVVEDLAPFERVHCLEEFARAACAPHGQHFDNRRAGVKQEAIDHVGAVHAN
eukprot:540971-Prymnesium_polylepis.1